MAIAMVPLEVIDRIMSFLSLADVARLSAAGKSLGESINEVLDSSRPFQRLVRGLGGMYLEFKTLSRASTTSLHRLWAAVRLLQGRRQWPWGQAAAATPGLTKDLSALFSVPHTPLNVALHFTQHVGLHISYQQLLDAARSRVAGVEVWVQAQQELSILTDIPCEAIAVFWKLIGAPKPLPPARAADILYLAFNYEEHAANKATHLLSQVTDVSTLAELLLTAVRRQHTAAVRRVLELPLAQELSVQQIISVLEELIDTAAAAIQHWQWQCQPWLQSELAIEVVGHLDCLPGAAKITSEGMVQLIQTALHKGAEDVVYRLCWKTEAARQMNVSALVETLQLAIREKRNEALSALVHFPAARHISPENIAELLMAFCQGGVSDGDVSLHQGPRHTIWLLCRMQPKAEIPARLLDQLVKTAVTTGTGGLDTMCRELKAVRDLFESEGEELLRELIALHQEYQPSNLSVAEEFFKLPTAECIPMDSTVKFLQEAMQQGNLDFVNVICSSPASKQLNSSHVQDLLNTAVRVYHNDCRSTFVQRLRNLAAAGDIPVVAIQKLMSSAVVQHNRSSLSLPDNLSQAVRMTGSDFAKLAL